MYIKGKLYQLKNKLVGQSKVNTSERTTVVSTDLPSDVKAMLESGAKFKEGYVSPISVAMAHHFTSIRNINLDAKVDDFIEWYFINMVKGTYSDIGELHKPNDMRNFIEKMAVWYELRYPDYEINRLMPGSSQERKEINDVMFNSNKYINELFDENNDIRLLDWDKFYSAQAFIKSLPCDEKYLLDRAKYSELVYIDLPHSSANLHLTTNGFVEEAEGMDVYTNYKVKDDDLTGMHIKDVVKLLKEKGVSLPKDNELEQSIQDVEKWSYQKEEMLNCVMYRLIERGGNRIGPCRAFLFAKEFKRNIDIPMMYGVDYSDPGLRSFINEYLKAGGSKELLCYVGYFTRASKMEPIKTVSVQEMINTLKYTSEETALHQKLVNVLASQVDPEVVRTETVKQLRLERRLNKSKN